MSIFRRILVCLEPSLEQTAVVDRAIALAQKTRAKLLLVYHDRGPDEAGGRASREVGAALAERAFQKRGVRLDELAAHVAEQAGVDVGTLHERNARSAAQLVDLAQAHGADLIMKDTGHEAGVRRLLFSCLDWDLLRMAPMPVWLVGGHRRTLPARIVAAVDPIHPEHGAGRLNDLILDTAAAVTKAGHGALRVVTAFEGLPPELMRADPSGMSLPFALDEVYEEQRVAHAKAFDALLDRKHIPRARGTVLYGSASALLADAIVDFDAELMVVGVMRRHGLRRIALGSTAERLVSDAPCDVLAVPASLAERPVASRTSARRASA